MVRLTYGVAHNYPPTHTIKLMAKIFAILTALVLVVSAFLAFKNKGSEDTPRAGYRGWITAKEQQQDILKDSEEKLEEEKAKLEKTNEDLAELTDSNKGLQAKVDGIIAENGKLKSEKEEKETLAATKKEEVETAKSDLVNVGDLREALDNLKQTEGDIASTGLEISEKEAQVAVLEQQKNQSQAAEDEVREQIKYRVTQESSPDLRTTVAGVYPSLGFVTLAAGDNLGVVEKSTLNVLRGDQVVGKLMVTTVEARTAAADIVPDSFVDGDSVRRGDVVVPAAKLSPSPEPATAPPAVDIEPVG